MAGMILFVGKKCNDPTSIDTPNIQDAPICVARDIFYIGSKARNYIINLEGQISPQLLINIQAQANSVLNSHDSTLKTRVYNESMLSVFAHEDNYAYAHKVEPVGIINNNEDNDNLCCTIL